MCVHVGLLSFYNGKPRYGQVEGSTKTLSEAYRVDNLTYDKNGNILILRRSGTSTAPEMDKLAYTYKTHSNRLRHVYDKVSSDAYPNDIDNQKPDNYIYNDIGQLIFNEQDNLGYEYYTNGLTKAIYNGKIGEAGTTKRVEFQYNESGHRIKKLSYNNQGTLLKTTFYVRDAAGTAIAIYFKDEGSTDKSIILAENVVYGSSRLGTLNRTTETMLYEIKDHLGNVRAVVGKDADGNMASIVKGRADYYPFGMQFPDKQDLDYRYAYQGQEKDDETGMEAFQLRLWDNRLGRWLTPDPAGQYYSPYLGMGNNPISRIDPDGGEDGIFEVGKDGTTTKISNAGDDIGQDTYIYSDGSGYIHHGDGSFTDFAASASMSNSSMAQQWAKGNLAQQMAYGTLNSFYTTAQWAMLKQPLDQLNNDGFENAMLNLDGSYTTTNDAAMNWSGSFMTMFGIGGLKAPSLTSVDGFLGRGINVKTPVNISVQRFGNMNISRPDFWGIKVGSNKTINRVFVAIKPEWNSLSQYTTGVIPKGTPIKFGIVGPQGGKHIGGSIQFIVPSKDVINQATKIVN